jgi:hypothetical protein
MSSPQTTGAALLPSQRHLFDIPDDVAFLNCAYMSPLPKASVAAGERGLARKARPWMITPEDFFSASEAVRARFAGLINAARRRCFALDCLQDGTSGGEYHACAHADNPGLAEQFPSSLCVDGTCRAHRCAVHRCARPDDDEWTAALLAAIDTATASSRYINHYDGGLIDLSGGIACRRVGAVLCVDAPSRSARCHST